MERPTNTRECGRPTRDINRRDTSFSKCAQLIRPEKLSLERHLNYLSVHMCFVCIVCGHVHPPPVKQTIHFQSLWPMVGTMVWTIAGRLMDGGHGASFNWFRMRQASWGVCMRYIDFSHISGGPTPFLRMLKWLKWIRSQHSHCYRAGSTVHLL